MQYSLNRILVTVTFIFIGIVAGIVMVGNFDILSFNSRASESSQNTKAESSYQALQLEESFMNVAEVVGGAVVSISTEINQKVQDRRFYFSPFSEDEFFGKDDFFDKFFRDFFGEMPDREFKRRGLGSGVIIDSEGYILTNQHVVEDAAKITVTLPDGREYVGKVKGEDFRSDLAVIKIEANNLPVVKLGNSDDVRIGQWVIAAGNPFGFAVQNPEPTVTAGIISALDRSLPKTSRKDAIYTGLIQTDAAINPGNSGGPLVNLQGEVIGINVAIFTTSGGYQGVGFAIPVNRAKRILSRLKQGKEVFYGWLGIYMQDIDKELADYFNLPDQKGILISKIVEDSPADKSGFKNGDIVLKFDGKLIKNSQHLIEMVSSTEVGKLVTSEVIRNGKKIKLRVKVGKRPSEQEEQKQKLAVSQDEVSWRGMKIKELSKELAGKYRINIDKGLIIISVESKGPAYDIGLSSGDVIISINNKAIDNIKDFKKIISKIGNRNTLIQTASKGYDILKGE